MEVEIPVTERSNVLSKNIDISSPCDIVSTLQKCDEEIFNGWNGSKGLNAEKILTKIQVLSSKIADVIKVPSTGFLCVGGCGTSGRLGYITCQKFNEYLKSQGRKPSFHYIMAGGDKALFTSQELAEDEPHIGAQLLEKVTTGKSRVVYIGVSCGLSASFVAGQLDHCLSQLDRLIPVCLGFNPIHMARELPIPNWNKTFLSVVKDLKEAEDAGHGFILNPIIGPDPITGSSRMKSGSATRILLEVTAIAAIHGYNKQNLSNLVLCYKQTCDSVYKHSQQLGELIQMAGDCLRQKGHIYYLGCDGKAMMAMVDASECPPTYGAARDDVKGFIYDGYKALQNNEGDLSAFGDQYLISFKDFETDIVPYLTENDLIVFIEPEAYSKFDEALFRRCCKKVLIHFQPYQLSPHKEFDLVLHIQLDVPALQIVIPDSAKTLLESLLQEIALKWVLNSMSTGAHILKGKVFSNWMVDVQTSNTKLYLRAIGIIQKISGRAKEEAEECLLRSIYDKDEIDKGHQSLPIIEHIKTAREKNLVVPVAILMACQRCSLSSAKKQLAKEPILRKLLCDS